MNVLRIVIKSKKIIYNIEHQESKIYNGTCEEPLFNTFSEKFLFFSTNSDITVWILYWSTYISRITR